jgi:UDP-GlcNAc3NAcA epimerase
MKKIAVVIGARPQFIKHAPLEIELKKEFLVFSIHTGQHYDQSMSDIFFDQLKIDKPNYLLNVGSGKHGKMTGIMIEKIEEVLIVEKPDFLLVYGDTNSTLAGAVAASKLNIPVIHIEAGLRSFNRNMPEEINRVITDHVSKYLFAPTNIAVHNLHNEGIIEGVYNVGDVMYDSLLLAQRIINKKKILKDSHILLTIHRPYNTDNCNRLIKILEVLNSLNTKIIFPIHPRTSTILNNNNVDLSNFINIEFIQPVSYFDLVKLQLESSCIITDSGGVQKEAYLLKKKCITLRSETEWTETLQNGWNTLVFEDLESILDIIEQKPGSYVEGVYGNGNTAYNITQKLKNNN